MVAAAWENPPEKQHTSKSKTMLTSESSTSQTQCKIGMEPMNEKDSHKPTSVSPPSFPQLIGNKKLVHGSLSNLRNAK
jgi:hypothetical protein